MMFLLSSLMLLTLLLPDFCSFWGPWSPTVTEVPAVIVIPDVTGMSVIVGAPAVEYNVY